MSCVNNLKNTNIVHLMKKQFSLWFGFFELTGRQLYKCIYFVADILSKVIYLFQYVLGIN